jgi:hypothetical protein
MGDDYIMDKLCKEMGLNPDKCNFGGFQKAIEKYFNKSEEDDEEMNYGQENSDKLKVNNSFKLRLKKMVVKTKIIST